MNKCLERINDLHFWNPGVLSYAMIPRCCPNSRVFFIVASVVFPTEYRCVQIQMCDKEFLSWKGNISNGWLVLPLEKYIGINLRTVPVSHQSNQFY
jgi:hypothetical protein